MNTHAEQLIDIDEDVLEHLAAPDKRPPQQNDFKQSDFMQKLPALLRILGAGALIVAMYSFLVKGWQSGNDVTRYLLMLGHTGLLATIGLASSRWLKENKGARLLLTLATVSVPVNFAILGALIFSQTGALNIAYPNYVAWSVDSLDTALFTAGGAMFVLIPVTLLGFAVLARSISKKLSILFLMSNAMLLLPIRDPQMVAMIVIALMGITLYFNKLAFRNHTAARTQEGITALGLLMIPVAVLMGRSLWLYSADQFLLTVMSATIFVVMRQLSLYMDKESFIRQLIDHLSLVPAVITTIFLSATLVDTQGFSEEIIVPLSGVVATFMVFDVAKRVRSNGMFYRRLAMLGLVVGITMNLALFSNLTAALVCIALGIGLVVIGYRQQQRNQFMAGAFLTTIGFLHQLYQLVEQFDLGGWITLAALGIIAIVAASIMESQGGKLKPRLEQWKNTYKEWEA